MNSLFHLAAPEWTSLKNIDRLQALAACGIFATRPESDFDDLVRLAALSCDCSSAMIAFADSESLHFKSTFGANKPLLRKVADRYFIPTVQHDQYIWSNELADGHSIIEEDTINFFSGVSLKANDNQVVGILCVTDPQPRQLSDSQTEALNALGRQTEHQLTLRRMITVQSELIKQRDDDLEIRRQSEARLSSALSRVSLVHEIGKAARSGEDPDSILRTAITKLGQAMSADRCYFVTYEPATNAGTIGPDWYIDSLQSISVSYKMFDFPYNEDPSYLEGHTSVIEDVLSVSHTPGAQASADLGLRSLLRAPVIQGSQMTALCVAMGTPRVWTEDEIALVETVAAQTRAAVETARHALRERALLRDVLASVTEGKLILADSLEQLPQPLTPSGVPILLTKSGGLAELREVIRAAGKSADQSEVRTFDIMTAASEAGMNAIVHAETGVATVTTNGDGIVQVKIEDQGQGIAFDDLPKATLARGYSTKSTLGHGLKMMLETIDRLFLLTGPSGTTVVLEQERLEPTPHWLPKHHSQ